MTDLNGPPPLNSIYLYLADRCNLRCRHCWIAPAYTDTEKDENTDVDIRYLKKALTEAMSLGLASVKLTGGEPFLRRDIVDIIEYLSTQNVRIDIETNGTLLNQDIVEKIEAYGVHQVSVSLDSTAKKQHEFFRGIEGCYEGAIRGLSLLSERKINTQIIMTLYKDNVSEIEKMAELASGIGIGSLKINPIMPTGRGKDFFANDENIPTEELIRIDRWIEDELLSKFDGLDIYFDLPIALRSIKSITTRSSSECHIFNIIGILADGTISLCGIGETETDLNMGNIARDDIGDVWANHPILQRLRKDIPRSLEGICGRCIFKFRCRGACRASAYALTGNLNSPFFACDDASRKGLFLESRITSSENL